MSTATYGFQLRLSLLVVSCGITALDATAREIEVRFTGGATSGLLVYSAKYGSPLSKLGRIDGKGGLTDNYGDDSTGVGYSPHRYYVLPHDPNRWVLSKATNEAPPSVEALHDDREMMERLAKQVNATWAKDGNEHYLITDALPESGMIRMRTQDASGAPLVHREVELFACDLGHGFSSRQTAVWSGKTDGKGAIQIRQFPGIHGWIIRFPGLGHTQAGPIVVDPRSTSDIQLNRLVPFATISGRIDNELLKDLSDESRVYLSTPLAWQYREATVDTEGRFRIVEVPIDGNYAIRIKDIPTEHQQVHSLLPGENRSGVILERSYEPAGQQARLGQLLEATRNQRKTLPTLRGRVIDENGNGVPGATVFATMKFYGGVRMYQDTEETKTDDEGEYEIEDADLTYGSVALVAYKPGRPLAIGAGDYFGPAVDSAVLVGVGGAMIGRTPEQELRKVLDQPDLVLPSTDKAGTLSVTTLNRGVPLGGVSVQLELMDFQSTFSPGWAAGLVPESLMNHLKPRAETDAQGEAIFRNLVPGLYRITASIPNDATEQPEVASWYRQARNTTSVVAVAVVAGRSRNVQIPVSVCDLFPVPMRVVHVDGTPLAETTPATFWAKPAIGVSTHSMFKLDARGHGQFGLQQKGMWQVSARYVTPSLGATSSPLRFVPSYAAERQIAVSELAPRKTLVVLRAHRVAPALITAVVEDENGKPAQGAVLLDAGLFRGIGGHETHSASTDGQGTARFEGVQTGMHKLEARIPGWSTASVSLDTEDDVLEDQFAVPSQVVEVTSGAEKIVRLRRQRVAYIRGRITDLPAAENLMNAPFHLADSWVHRPLRSDWEWSRETGAYIIGPVLPGKHTIVLETFAGEKPVSRLEHTVEVTRPGVHREDIPYPPKPATDSGNTLPSIGGNVYAADGETPIYCARLAVFAPGSGVSQDGAWSDARGRFTIHPNSNRILLAQRNAESNGSPQQPVLVAWLPGDVGATITPLPQTNSDKPPQELRVVLPNRAIVRGTITVGGKPPLGLPASIQVLAQHDGGGKLDSLLSVMTAASADGSYELRGLTPSVYRVQACLDGIWMSPSQSITIPTGKEFSRSVDLDIPAPGDAAQYRLLNRAGTPVANEEVLIHSPELNGPFAQAVRPATITTDSDGVLYLEGLSAGEHSVELKGTNSIKVVRVPPIGSPIETPLDLRFD